MSTTADLLELVQGVGQRQSEVRYDVLDGAALGSVIGTVTPRSDATPTVAVNTDSAVKRTLSNVRLTESDQASLDVFSHRIRPVWVLQNGAEFPLGVFVLGSRDRLRFDYGLEAQVSGVDQSIIVDQATDRTVAGRPNDNIAQRIREQLSAATILSYVVDDLGGASIEAPIAWPAGTSRLQIVNDLAALGGGLPAYFDRDGVCRVRAAPDLNAETASLVYAEGGRIVNDSIVESDDLLTAPNRYIVIDSSNQEYPITATYDIPASAPTSFENRHFLVTKVISEQGLAGFPAARARAQTAYREDGGGTETVRFTTPPDPRHDIYDVVNYLGVNYQEKAWSLPLVEGSPMSHDLARVYPPEVQT